MRKGWPSQLHGSPHPTDLNPAFRGCPGLHLTLFLPVVVQGHAAPLTALSSPPPSWTRPLTVGMLQDAVDEHRVLGDALSH